MRTETSAPRRTQTPVRTGAMTLLITMVVLCLAVLATLALVTAHKSLTIAGRQQTLALRQAAAETAGQEWLARVDAALAQGTDLPADATRAADGSITGDLAAEDGVVLHIAVQPTQGEDGRYRITRWQPEQPWQDDSSLTLWPGN